MEQVNKNVKQINVKFILLLIILAVASFSFTKPGFAGESKNISQKQTQQEKIKQQQQKEIEKDLKLNIEQLRAKYSIEWWEPKLVLLN